MIQLKTANGKVDLQEDKNNITLTASVSKGAVNSVNGQQGDVVLDIPAKTSQLENDSDFQNEAEVKQLIASNALPLGTNYRDVLICNGFNHHEGVWYNLEALMSELNLLSQWNYTEDAYDYSFQNAAEFYIAINTPSGITPCYIKLRPNQLLSDVANNTNFYFPCQINYNDVYNTKENYIYWNGNGFTFSPYVGDTFTIAYIYYR